MSRRGSWVARARCLWWSLAALIAGAGVLACGGDASPGEACPSGFELCGDTCVLTAIDPRHCGGCDQACAGLEVCSGGACVLSCAAAEANCDGACVNLQIDARHCGACGQRCTGFCYGGECLVAPPDLTQPGRIPRAMLQGEWYFQQTVVGLPGEWSFTFGDPFLSEIWTPSV